MTKPTKKASSAKKPIGLYQASAMGDLKQYKAIEARWFKRWGKLPFKPNVNSPMAQFDQSHRIWVKNGREC